MMRLVSGNRNRGSRWMVKTFILLAILRVSSALYGKDDRVSLAVGNACKVQTGEPGICKRILDCAPIVEGYRKKTISYSSIVRCSFTGFTEVICCPLNYTPPISGTKNTSATDWKKVINHNTNIQPQTTSTTTRTTTKRPIFPNIPIPSSGSFPGTWLPSITTTRRPQQNRTPGLSTTTTTGNRRPSQVACRRWKLLNFPSHSSHDMDGVPVPPCVFAHIGAIIEPISTDGRPDFVVLCETSLISNRFALTAANCVAEELSWPMFARFGVVKWNSKDNSVDVEIEEVIRHPNYRHPLKYNDIALIKLLKRIHFTPFIRPACLYSDMGDIDSAQPLEVIGWNFEDANISERTDALFMTSVKTVSLHKCNQTHILNGVSRNYEKGIDHGQYCASNLEVKKDSCELESGGPLQMVENMETTIVGIMSFGYSCDTVIPPVYSRVAFYLDWIESIVWHNHNQLT